MLKPVEMLFTSDKEGNLIPIRYRIDIDGDLLVVPVKNPIVKDENTLPGTYFIEYRADLVINNQLCPGRLRLMVNYIFGKLSEFNKRGCSRISFLYNLFVCYLL